MGIKYLILTSNFFVMKISDQLLVKIVAFSGLPFILHHVVLGAHHHFNSFLAFLVYIILVNKTDETLPKTGGV